MSVVSELLEVRDLISDPAHWCQGQFAKDCTGLHINSRDPRACQWCLEGALLKCHASHTTFNAIYAATDGSPVQYNDTHTHAEVVAVVDRVIAAKTEEGIVL